MAQYWKRLGATARGEVEEGDGGMVEYDHGEAVGVIAVGGFGRAATAAAQKSAKSSIADLQ